MEARVLRVGVVGGKVSSRRNPRDPRENPRSSRIFLQTMQKEHSSSFE